MAQSKVFTIIQDKQGQIWMGTLVGIDKYNGYAVQHYNISDTIIPFGKRNQINKLFLDSKNRIWVGSKKGISFYNPEKDRFDKLTWLIGHEVDKWHYFDFEESSDGTIWAGATEGVVILDVERQKYQALPSNERFNRPITLKHISETEMLIGGRNMLDIYSLDGSRLDSKTELLIEVCGRNNFEINSIVHTNKSEYVLGTTDHGLILIDFELQKARKLLFNNQFPDNFTVRDIDIDDQGNLLISTDGHGLLILDPALRFLDNHRSNVDDLLSLSNDGLYELCIDNAGRWWISTFGGGVNMHDPNRKRFTTFTHIINDINSLPNSYGRAFFEDRQGNYWFGTKAGLSKLDNLTKKWVHYKHDPEDRNSISGNIVLSITEDFEGRIWIGIFGGGVCRIDPGSGKINRFVHDLHDTNTPGSESIYYVYTDLNGFVWAGALGGALSKYNPETGKFDRHKIKSINCIVDIGQRYIYMGGWGGLYFYDPINGYYEYFDSEEDSEIRLSNNVITSIGMDDDKLIIGTMGGGLNIVNLKSREINYFTINNGFPAHSIFGIEIDNTGNYWLSTENGLLRFDPEKETSTIFRSADGLPSNEFITGAHGKTRDGKIVFGTPNGFTIFDPNHLTSKKIETSLLFEGLRLFDKPLDLTDSDARVKTHIDILDTLLLEHDQNSLSFEFAAINYTSAEKTNYQWTLENFDESWNEPSQLRTATYTKLPPGEYIFKVKAINEDFIQGSVERKLYVVISPPIWLTLFAKIFYVLLLIGLIALIFYLIDLWIKEKYALEKIRFFVNIAHDIKTPLTLITTPLQELTKISKDNTRGSELLATVNRNAKRMAKIVNQLIDFQKSDLNKTKVHYVRIDIVSFIEMTIRNFQPLIDQKKITIEKKCSRDSFDFICDVNLMEKIFYNLISNAIKYSHENGKITIKLKCKERSLKISIRDKGIGIPKSDLKNIFKKYYRAENAVNSAELGSGVGLMLVKNLVKLHKGKISCQSKENHGTTFLLEFPNPVLDVKQVKIIPETESEPTAKDSFPPNENINNEREFKTLIIEDNPELRKYLKERLAVKYDVRALENGEKGLESMESFMPDIVISDVMMPGKNGFEVCQEIKMRVEWCHIPVILLTALNSTDDSIQGLEYGADAYIGKPFDFHYLEARISNLLNSRKVLRKRFGETEEELLKIDFQNKLDNELIERINSIVNEHLLNPEFSVLKLSKEIGMSRPSLYLKIKALTDKSPQDFIKIIRLKKARRMLLDPTFTITEVAFGTGFSDPKYFSTSYRKFFGSSPSDYRKKTGGIENKEDVKYL